MRFKYILFFLLILPLTLCAQLTKNERYWLNYHLTTDPKLAEYSSELHNKFLNDPSNLAQLKQCTNSLIYQRIGESLLGFNTLTDLADHVSEQYGEEYTREIIPKVLDVGPERTLGIRSDDADVLLSRRRVFNTRVPQSQPYGVTGHPRYPIETAEVLHR